MIFHLSAACGSNTGLVRSSNEDNFSFAGRHMSQENQGTPAVLSLKKKLVGSACYAVFDGMGGEACGEVASFSAARTMAEYWHSHADILGMPQDFLNAICQEMNITVYNKAKALHVGTMGTTAVILLFSHGKAYICNLGDSRAYRLRENKLLQLSTDDWEVLRPGSRRKPGITQYLGISPEEMRLEPYIVQSDIRSGDVYLICSDGITDMLPDAEICSCLRSHISSRRTVESLICSAMRNGGRDNATAIVARVL